MNMTRITLAAAALLAARGAALAVGPASWVQAAEADFSAGTLDKTVVDSTGQVSLARALDPLLPEREDLGMISALAIDAQGRTYFAAAPGGVIYRLEDKKPVKFATLPGVLVRSMLFVKDELVAGAGGKGGGLFRIDAKGAVAPIWSDPAVKLIWAVVPAPQGGFYVGTGPEGKVFHVAPDGKAAVIYDSDDDNILSLALGKDGRLYAGTGENGLIIEIEPARQKGRILYDAPEKEISCLAVDAEGVLYAGTSDAGKSGGVPSDLERPRPTLPSVPVRPSAPPGLSGSTGEGAATSKVSGGSAVSEPAPGASSKAAATGAAAAPAPATAPAEAGSGSAGPSTRPPAAVPVQVARPVPRPPTVGGPSAPSTGGEPEPTGNAVYRIDPEGFVRPIFRRPVAILAMALEGKTLTLATGHSGQVFAVGLGGEERSTVLAKLDGRDATALTAGGKGGLIVATADKAAVYALGTGFAAKGTLVGKVLDAGQIARWGTVSVRADAPPGCSVTLATRSGNVAEPKDNTWSSWSPEIPAGDGWTAIASPVGKYLQYRLMLAGNGQTTPTVDQVRLVYQVNNLAPVIRLMQVTPTAKGSPGPGPAAKGDEAEQPLRYRAMQFRADDPNGDTLRYSVFYRRAGQQKWVKLSDKLTEPAYVWDTLGTEDGSYEIKVEASDEPSNPPASALKAEKISRPVTVDNTPPRLTELTVKPAANGEASLSGTVVDDTSRIRQIAYAVDSNDEWTVVLPADGICDSQKETFATTLKGLKEGPHRIAVRVTDEFNNAGYASAEVTIGK